MKKFTTELAWGGIFVIVALCWMYFEKLMGWHGENIDQHMVMTNMFAIVATAVFVLALRDKRKRDLNGEMTWRQGFTSGGIITAVIAVLSPLAQWVEHTYLSPEYFPNIIAYSVQQGKATVEQAEAYFNLESYIVQSMIMAVVMGLLTSALAAFFVRTEK